MVWDRLCLSFDSRAVLPARGGRGSYFDVLFLSQAEPFSSVGQRIVPRPARKRPSVRAEVHLCG